MKNFWKFFGVVTLVVVAGFFLVSCGDDDDSVVYRDIMGRVVLEPGSQGTAGNKEVTGLASGFAYFVEVIGTEGHVVEGAILHSRNDGTLATVDTLSDVVTAFTGTAGIAATALDFGRTRIRGLENENSGYSYNFYKYILVADDITISNDPAETLIDTRGRNLLLEVSTATTGDEVTVGPGAGVAAGTTFIFYGVTTIATSIYNATLEAIDPIIGVGGVTFTGITDDDSDVRITAIAGDDYFIVRGITPDVEFTAVLP